MGDFSACGGGDGKGDLSVCNLSSTELLKLPLE